MWGTCSYMGGTMYSDYKTLQISMKWYSEIFSESNVQPKFQCKNSCKY